ncbi:MAG TPA: enoyl-CoA hydratase-related protein, partial [Hyphomicrobiaceae bacterium]|nr:enoyl-CoA hydratase-related protein [Hyphomicrobiaceae bacterium]
MSEPEVVRFSVEDGIGVITIDYPPVNALGPGVSDGIIDAIDKGEADPAVKALVMIGAGRTFIAGADIRGFGKPRKVQTRKTYDVLDAATKPVVAAIHGYALGGGLENALACHYRVAVPSAKVGLPEVLIGIIPGGGGTQRLPRLIGPKAALDLIVSGEHIPAEHAKSLGIIDEVVPGKDLLAEAKAYAKSIAGTLPLPRVRDKTDKLQNVDPAIFEAKAKSIARRTRGQPAPGKAIEAVKATLSLPFDDGIALERRLFEELVATEEAEAMRYAFFSEREIARVPHLPRDLKLPEIKSVAVIGAGTMGGGIAMSMTDAG